MQNVIVGLGLSLTVLVGAAGRAEATECGETRREVDRLKAAITVDETARRPAQVSAARAKLQLVEKKLAAACATHKATIVALPLGYVTLPEGNGARAEVTYGENWEIKLTTLAGAKNGVVIAGAATLSSPWGTKLVAEAATPAKPWEPLVAVALGPTVTFEEPRAGEGTWKIALASPPELIALAKLRSCADGKVKMDKLPPSACKMLANSYPLATSRSVPERGRAVLVGEWQYGWKAEHTLTPTELGPLPENSLPMRLDLDLELTAPLADVSDGKRLPVTIEGNRQTTTDGTLLQLAHACNDDEACEKKRFAVEVYWDRVFAMPLIRPPVAGYGNILGKVTDRLAKPLGGQRLLVTGQGRRIIAITDKDGEFKISGLGGGDYMIYPVGKDPTNLYKSDEKHPMTVGFGDIKMPVIFMNRLHE